MALDGKKVLTQLNQLALWYKLIGVGRVNTFFRSPLRHDRNPGAKLYVASDGVVKMSDPPAAAIQGLSEKMDLIDVVRYQRNCSYKEALNYLIEENGGIGEAHIPPLLKRQEFIFEPHIVPFSPQGLIFWEKRGVGLEALNDASTKTYQIRGYRVHGTNAEGKPVDYTVEKRGFAYEANGKYRVYFPYEAKDKKFRGVLSNTDVWHWENPIWDGETLLMAKSHKDLQVWKRFTRANLMCPAAENALPDNLEWLWENIQKKYRRLVICFDSDDTGFKGASRLKAFFHALKHMGELEIRVWNFPAVPEKDLDGYRVIHGHEATLQFLKDQNHYGILNTG